MRFAWIVAAAVLAMAGNVTVIVAIYNERRMQRHRQPGVSYAQATFRRDGGWGRADLFTPEGLTYQRRAARYGVIGVVLWILAMGAWLGAVLSGA
jgi:hypothetical protein